MFEDSYSGGIELILINTVPDVDIAFQHANLSAYSLLLDVICFVFLDGLQDHLEVLSDIAVVAAASF